MSRLPVMRPVMRRPSVTRWRIGLVALPLAVALMACGADDGRFDASADDVRAAIEAEDRTAAVEAIDALAIEGLAAHEAGALSDGELDEFARRIESLRVQVDALLPPAPTTTTTAAPRPTEEDDEDDAKRKGKKHRDKDDEDDD